ncbi:hypothetical protein RJT34_31557 [Clitoria ternatea]|uniref:Conserved oligomeric Golgi complex subunit 7 n=1 Tax=Clitoria ternatea TaxID=43366 RepID=A0AAN9EUH4_CLITE
MIRCELNVRETAIVVIVDGSVIARLKRKRFSEEEVHSGGTMMLDLGPFSNENFDPKKWINSACQSRHPQDSLDKHLLDMEMKLQMASRKSPRRSRTRAPPLSPASPAPRATSSASATTPFLSVQLCTLSSRSSRRYQPFPPSHSFEVHIHCTNSKPTSLIRSWPCSSQEDGAAHETLRDAAGLTQLSSTVEDVFASGDLPRAAETLANMGHYLSAVGEVAEFANIRKQLEVLEDRLDMMVQPRLTDALSNRKVY